MREKVKAEKQLREVATLQSPYEGAVLAGNAGVAELLGSVWGPWQGGLRPRSVVSEPAAAAGGWGAVGTPMGPAGSRFGPIHPTPLPPSPLGWAVRSPPVLPSTPCSPSASRCSGRRITMGRRSGKFIMPSLNCWCLPRAGVRLRRHWSWQQHYGAQLSCGSLGTPATAPARLFPECEGGFATLLLAPPPGQGVPGQLQEADLRAGQDAIPAGAGRGGAGKEVAPCGPGRDDCGGGL